MENKILVIADDLTGAGDIAYWSVKKGLKTIISRIKSLNKKYDTYDVIIINTDTRHVAGKEAYSIVYEICNQAKEQGIKYIFKKIDSTLRGNFVQENDALCDALGIKELAFGAAFPEYGRTTKDGYHYVNGVRLDKTEFAKDPKSPVKESHIPTLINKISKHPERIKVFDMQSEQDSACVVNKTKALWDKQTSFYKAAAGSSWFFGKILEHYTKKGDCKKCDCPLFLEKIIISASRNPVSVNQVKTLCRQKQLNLEHETAEYMIYRNEKKNLSVITSPYSLKDEFFLNRCIKVVEKLITKEQALLVLCGGDTANEVCSFLNIDYIDCVQGLFPGIILGKDIKSSRYLIFKPGGYGAQDALLHLANSL